MTRGVQSGFKVRYPADAAGTGWLTFPFAANYQALGGGFQSPQYRLVGGWVYLRGTMTRNTATAGAGSTCGTLPAIARPPASLIFAAILGGVVCRVDVSSSGAVQHVTQALAVGDYLSLDGISFAAG